MRNNLNAKRRRKDQQSQTHIVLSLAQPKVGHTDLEKFKEKLRKGLLKKMWGVDITKALMSCHVYVFSEVVMATPFPDNFKINMAAYDGKEDLDIYICGGFSLIDGL